jgi:hypothetical protein
MINRATWLSVTVGGILAAAVVSGPVWAAEKKASGPNRAPAKASSPGSEAVAQVALAEELARYGREKKDPLALLAAARIKQAVGDNPTERKKETKGGTGEATKTATDSTSVAALVDQAKALAGGRPDIVALADEVAKSDTRGRVSGPGSTTTVVRRVGTDVFSNVVFRGGETAMVMISGDGDSDLDLYVFDERGNLICQADSRTDAEICRWTPRWTGPFRIEVRNLGVANQYVLRTN